jgi:glycosyltransferase involved in cell wall biosynthesis
MRLPRRQLRVGVPAGLFDLLPLGGHGKVWHRVLGAMAPHVGIRRLDPATGRPLSRRQRGQGDVVLADGHGQLLPVKAPLVVQVHEAGWFTTELRETLDPDFYRGISERTQAAVRTADRVITPSAAAARDLAAFYDLDPERVHGVPLGVDSCFSTEAAGGRALVARSRAGADAPYVLFAAAIHPRKNLGALREAVARLAREGLPHVLVVAGGPAADRPDSSELERAASAELPGAPGRVVRFASPSDAELAGLMAEADAFCLPSLYEGFGLTALEAMACGAPVAVSDRGSLPEVVGEAATVAAPTPDGLHHALREILTDASLAAELRRAGPRRAHAFTWERTAEGWLDVLRRAATD